VTLAGRQFHIKKQFLDDLEATSFRDRIAKMRKALLIFHSPTDDTVGIGNAQAIFEVAKHPKSFVSLDGADHLLSRREDAAYVAEVLSAWASRYITGEMAQEKAGPSEGFVVVSETGDGKFQQSARVGPHSLVVDEPTDVGGMNSGPTPYDFLAI